MKCAVLLLALVSLTLSSPVTAGGASPRVAPDFTIVDLSGERVSLKSLRGEAVIVLFSDPNCGVCRENDRLLRQYQLEYLTHGLTVVSVQENVTLEQLQRYDMQFLTSTLTGLDPGRSIARQYSAFPLPTTVFIDREGNIRQVHRGRLREQELLQLLRTLL